MTHCATNHVSGETVPTLEDVLDLFKRLRMPGAAAVFASRSKEASFCEMDVVTQFHEVLQAEMARRLQNYYTRGRTAAGLVSMVTAADMSRRRVEYGLTPSMVRLLSTGEWRQTMHRIIIISPTGSGKTDLATAILDAALSHHLKCSYKDYSLVMMDLTQAYAAGNPELYQGRLRHYAATSILALDDICNGLPRTGEASVFKDLLDVCDARETRLVLVSQKTLSQWHAFLGGGSEADAAIDRVMHCQHMISLKGESRRSGRSVPDPDQTPGADSADNGGVK